MSDCRKVVIRRPGEADFIFCGRLIAEGSSSPLQHTDWGDGLFDAPEWTHIRIFELADGRFVAAAENYSDLRRVRRVLRICTEHRQLVDLLGFCDLAKAVYSQAGIDASARPSEPKEASEAAVETSGEDTSSLLPPEPDRSSAPTMTIVPQELLDRRLTVAKTNNLRRQLSALERLRDAGVERMLAQVEPGQVAKLADLESRFPNLSDVVQYFRRQLSLCGLSCERILRIPPVLLLGPPGVGKTRLLQSLTALLDAEFCVVPCGSITANFVLSGGDSQWSESKPGRIFEVLCTGKTGNPMIVLDEIDKLSGDRRYDCFGPLYSLLEPATAEAFLDECLGLEMDCSRIVWIATANDASPLPEPILSRFTTFEVRAPNKQEMCEVAMSVYDDLRESEPWGQAFVPDLPSRLLDRLSSLTPRRLRQVLLEAAGRVAERMASDTKLEGQFEISAEDIDNALPKTSRRRMGFVQS